VVGITRASWIPGRIWSKEVWGKGLREGGGVKDEGRGVTFILL